MKKEPNGEYEQNPTVAGIEFFVMTRFEELLDDNEVIHRCMNVLAFALNEGHTKEEAFRIAVSRFLLFAADPKYNKPSKKKRGCR